MKAAALHHSLKSLIEAEINLLGYRSHFKPLHLCLSEIGLKRGEILAERR